MVDLKDIYLKGLQHNTPDGLVKKALKEHAKYLSDKPLYIVGIGKAALQMAKGISQVLVGHNISAALIICPDDEKNTLPNHFRVIKGSHPLPDQKSLRAGKELINFVKDIPDRGSLITLISGGASSLAVYPADGISIEDLQELYRLLLISGADIYEINAVRKHLSKIKGGQLLRYLSPDVELIDLIISDVPNDDPAIIGSGLTTPDSSTFEQVKSLLVEYELWEKLPESIPKLIEKGKKREVNETIKPGEDPIKNHDSHIIGSPIKFAERVSEEFKIAGYKTTVAQKAYSDDVEQVASMIADEVVSKGNINIQKPMAYIYYGESTVEVTGKGKGGRNQELALRAALKIEGCPKIKWLSAGTDGIDGPTDAAGAIVDGATISEARQQGIDPEVFLKNNDSYHFHRQAGTLLKTGPTGNNLMDIQIVVIE